MGAQIASRGYSITSNIRLNLRMRLRPPPDEMVSFSPRVSL